MKIIRGTKLGAYGFKCVSPMQPALTWFLRESRAKLTSFRQSISVHYLGCCPNDEHILSLEGGI
jgi:hypothetical protein